MHKTTRENAPTPLSRGLLHSYELRGNRIVARLFGIVPVQNTYLVDAHYLRLATRHEMPLLHQLFNGLHLSPHRRCVRPVYVLQTQSRRRLFLRLNGKVHFKLRQSIARIHEPPRRRMATSLL